MRSQVLFLFISVSLVLSLLEVVTSAPTAKYEGTSDNSPETEIKIVFYPDEGYKGIPEHTHTMSKDNTGCHAVGNGSNDKFTSIQVDVCVALYDHANCRGTPKELVSKNTPKLCLTDKVSSFRLCDEKEKLEKTKQCPK